MPEVLLPTDLCVASGIPEVEEFRLAARAMRSSTRALERMDRRRRILERTTPPAVLREQRTLYLHDVYHPTHIWYREALEAAYAVAPDATRSIDHLYFPCPKKED
ncbi:hypothetical protein [Actinoallomurus sp. NPDC052274]|uniref:hypothetical protein n=1 Tax=Actinoallomurus sp. NPDC052274 TaxID=3155420 RepID=UPI00343B6F6C